MRSKLYEWLSVYWLIATVVTVIAMDWGLGVHTSGYLPMWPLSILTAVLSLILAVLAIAAKEPR